MNITLYDNTIPITNSNIVIISCDDGLHDIEQRGTNIFLRTLMKDTEISDIVKCIPCDANPCSRCGNHQHSVGYITYTSDTIHQWLIDSLDMFMVNWFDGREVISISEDDAFVTTQNDLAQFDKKHAYMHDITLKTLDDLSASGVDVSAVAYIVFKDVSKQTYDEDVIHYILNTFDHESTYDNVPNIIYYIEYSSKDVDNKYNITCKWFGDTDIFDKDNGIDILSLNPLIG